MGVRKHGGVKLPLHIWGIEEATAGRSKRFCLLPPDRLDLSGRSLGLTSAH
jgi:hypothetical protein